MKTARLFFLALSLLLTVFAARADVYGDVTQLMQGKRLEQAQARAQEHLKTKPRDPQMRYLLGLIQRERGQTALALDTFTQLTLDFPELPEPYNALAVIHASQGDFEQARAALELAVRANPGYATAHENLGDLHWRLAQDSWCKASQFNPSNEALKKRLATLNITCP